MKGLNIELLHEQMYLLNKGVRECFSFFLLDLSKKSAKGKTYTNDILCEIMSTVKANGLKCLIYRSPSNEEENTFDYMVYVFRHPSTALLIREIERDEKMPNLIKEYVKGKLYGYSDEEMDSFLTSLHLEESLRENTDWELVNVNVF